MGAGTSAHATIREVEPTDARRVGGARTLAAALLLQQAFGLVFDGRHEARAAHYCFYAAGGFTFFLLASMTSWRFRLRRRRR